MRIPALVAIAFLLPALAVPERLINVPTATKVPFGAIRVEAQSHQGAIDRHRFSLAAGIGEAWDLEASWDRSRRADAEGTFDLSYNYVPALPDAAPGISVGIRDAFNTTRDGSGAYISATFRYGQYGERNGESPAEVTVGGGLGAFRGVYMGTMLPVTDQFRLLAEHDSRRITAGIELRPLRDFRVRWVHSRDQSCVSVGWTYRF